MSRWSEEPFLCAESPSCATHTCTHTSPSSIFKRRAQGELTGVSVPCHHPAATAGVPSHGHTPWGLFPVPPLHHGASIQEVGLVSPMRRGHERKDLCRPLSAQDAGVLRRCHILTLGVQQPNGGREGVCSAISLSRESDGESLLRLHARHQPVCCQAWEMRLLERLRHQSLRHPPCNQ